jgi:hypothetical protein
LPHLDVHCIPRRSTLADANKRRDAVFFEALYYKLYQHFYGVLPDSLKGKKIEERLFIMDSTTISLFSDIMRGALMVLMARKREALRRMYCWVCFTMSRI